MAEVFPLEGLDYLLDVVPRGGASPTNLWLGLFVSHTPTTVPDADAVLATGSGVTEAAGAGYSRVAIPAASWGPAAPSPSGNREVTAAEVVFPEVGAGGWGTINGFLIATAALGGVAVCYANFDGGEPIVTAEFQEVAVTPTFEMRR